MVTHLISELSHGFPQVIFPTWSPQPSPSTPRRVIPKREKCLFMEFSCPGKPLGRIVIKVDNGAGAAGDAFEYLVTGKNGFGYKGSRVYACCKDEWFLMGDLLYQNPPLRKPLIADWDPCMSDLPDTLEGNDDQEDDQEDGEEGPSYRKLYCGSCRILQSQMPAPQPMTSGAVVAVASDYDQQNDAWMFGPQVKICLNECPFRSCHVLGTLTEGKEVAHELSRMGGLHYGPETRITVSDCGIL